MKKFFCIVFAAVFLLMFIGCSNSADESAVLPPSRIGEAGFQASFGDRYTFETAFAEADVVARIKVGNWIAEDTEIYITYYEATVLDCIKGDIPEKFTLLQDGCSSSTMKGYPLFTSGNELLVFLNEATLTNYKAPYWIIGSFTTILDVSYDADGSRYYIDRYGILGESMDISRNYALEEDVFSEVYANAVDSDPLVADMRYHWPYVFSEADVIALFGGQ